MSRGLKALKRIKTFMELNAKHWKQDVGYIEEELKEREEYKLIEKKLGIDLITLFKALKQGYYVKSPTVNCIFRKSKSYCDEGLYYDSPDGFAFNIYLKTKDYGKTWALTEEELK